MKQLLLCLTLLLITSLGTCVRAQKAARSAEPTTATWGKAALGGNADNFAVTPSGKVWRASATGELWHADNLGGSWSCTNFFNTADLSLKPFTLRDSLQFSSRENIQSITFETTSQGCFHFDQEVRTFIPGETAFRERKGRGEIVLQQIDDLLSHLLETPLPAQLKQLPLHPDANTRFEEMVRDAILEKEEARHDHSPRFNNLRDVSSLPEYLNLPTSTQLADAFLLAASGEEGGSTTTNTLKIVLNFRSGPPLALRYQYSYVAPNYLVWEVTYGKDAFLLPSGIVRDFYLQQLPAEERVAADAELLFQLAVWRAAQK